MENFVKKLRLGTIPTYQINSSSRMSIHVTVEYVDGKLSITGVEGPKANGNCQGSSGQIVMHLREQGGLDGFEPAPGWSIEQVNRLLEIWGDWHLNDMQAGTPAQMAWLKANPVTAVYPESHYDKASKALAAAGLNPDGGYKYGSKWLKVEVPDAVLAELQAFPDADTLNPWRD